MTNCIEIEGLCKSYSGFALEDVSLTLPGGTIMGLIGENGAGKTTTIKCILNLVRRDAGRINLLGQDSTDELAREEIGVVLDECFFHDTLRPRDIAAILSQVYRQWDDGLYRSYLDKFQLGEKQLVKSFSRGMKMKLSLAAALAHHPRLLLLDEATAGLDPVVREEMLDEFLSFIQDEDHAILLSSHIISDLEKAADYITYLHQGRVVLQGAKDELLEEYGRLACTEADLAAVDASDLVRVRRGTFGCEGLVRNRAEFGRKYPKLLVEKITLEDMMLLIGKGETV